MIRVSKGTGPNRTVINKVFRGRLADAKTHARELETMLDSGKVPSSKLTFGQFADLWLGTIRRQVKPLTYDNYEGNLRRHTVTLKTMRISEVESHHIQTIYNSLTPSVAAHLHATLRPMFKAAVRQRVVRSNPCEHTERPTYRRQREIPVFTRDELRRFIAICQQIDGGLIAEFAVETGMRPEEYLALRWTDIIGGDAIVSQIVQYNRSGGGFYFETPKTKSSRRRVPMSASLVERLRRHRIEQGKHRLALRVTWNDHGLVFPNAVGNPQTIPNLSQRTMSRIFAAFAFRSRLVPYDLRHICATTMLMEGVHIKVVSERLGHASIKITLDTYSHVIPTMQTEAVTAMDRAMRGV